MAIGPQQLLIIGLVLVVLFGARRFAALGMGLGQGIRNFKKGLGGVEDAARIEARDDKG